MLLRKNINKNPLTKEDKKHNCLIVNMSVLNLNENLIDLIKRFKIIADKYRKLNIINWYYLFVKFKSLKARIKLAHDDKVNGSLWSKAVAIQCKQA